MKIKLIHWNINQCEEKVRLLKLFGHQVDVEFSRDKETFKRIKEYYPDIFIIDLSRLPSNGKEITVGLRQIKSAWNIPIVFTEGGLEKVKRIKEFLPDAIYSLWEDIDSSLKKAERLRNSVKVVPLPMMERYSNTSPIKKLGIKENSQVALINPPINFKIRSTFFQRQ